MSSAPVELARLIVFGANPDDDSSKAPRAGRVREPGNGLLGAKLFRQRRFTLPQGSASTSRVRSPRGGPTWRQVVIKDVSGDIIGTATSNGSLSYADRASHSMRTILRSVETMA